MDKINKQKHFLLTNDKIIRSELRKDLDRMCKKHVDTKIIEELGISHGLARIDIAVVNGIIHGYELKSDMDNLKRLPQQIIAYNAVLDKVTLVVGEAHLYQAIRIIPEWWGITVTSPLSPNQNLNLIKIRKPEQNPNQNSQAIAMLLWREEALNILEKMGKAKGLKSKNRKQIYEKLVELLTQKELKNIVRKQLHFRINWRSDQRCILNDG
jgi:hypothetical protein